MISQFDKEGRYFAQLSEDGKLRVWNTSSNSFDQEYVPDLHLTSPCTCLNFVDTWQYERNNGSPKKKKKRNSFTDIAPDIVLGTSTGKLIVYSISKGDVKNIMDGNINVPITCLSSNNGEVLHAGAEENVVVWNLERKTFEEKWKTGNEKISAILVIPNISRLLTASKSIKLWNLETRALMKTFKGHSSEVCLLQSIPCVDASEPKYLISGSKGDRLLNCWNINEDDKSGRTTATFLMEDTVRNVAVNVASNGITKLAACIGNGMVHIFQLVLNGKCDKPLKPKSSIQVVSDTGQKQDVIIPILIFCTNFKTENSLLIAHGTPLALTFEDVELTSKNLICLIRKNPYAKKSSDSKSDKTLLPVVGNDVHYVSPFNNVASMNKRKLGGNIEVPMEKRLENLTLDKLDEDNLPKSGNMAQLLLQGLRSRDQNIIKAVLNRRDEQAIKNTIRRLPLKVISQLIKELTSFIQGKTMSSQIGAVWLMHLLQIHAALLISNPDLPDLFAPMLNSIENRLTLQTPLNRLRGRLDLLVAQVSSSTKEDSTENEDAVLIFNDKDSSDSDQDVDMADLLNSASENEWSEEQSTDDENIDENEKSPQSDDADMST